MIIILTQCFPPRVGGIENLLENLSFELSKTHEVVVLADQHNNVVKIFIDENTTLLKISADAQDVGSGSESLPAILNGEDIHIAFNVRYVLDGLKVMDSDRIVLRCNAPTTPAIISPKDDDIGFMYLVMPVQIRS